MLIASKYEEMYAPEVADFVYITDSTYSNTEIKAMERNILKTLDYSFGNPLCLHFLRRNSRAGDATPQMHTMAKFLMELCLPDYSMLEYLPSLVAAAALYISNKLYSDGEWTPALRHYSQYTEPDVLPCVGKMASLVLSMHTAKQQAVKNKYCSSKFMRIAKEPCLQGKIMKELASVSLSQ
ncbi:PREDICTED: G2/mitotic-specific cyclin-B-like [Amphimedon queenslandica]|nr:PREDICTED: G2/mitotic-specific cyclin-B-like [Amphimedon queenslandica]|eukprot:XP_011404046.1 PREDICTED: G2/mitotic-specific cyclin-B-like [Amphimedon queenslandica]